MARPKLHNFPPQNMLASIGRLLRAALDEEKAIVADARAKQAAEKRAMERSNQAREAAGKSYREWYDLHPDPPTSGAYQDEHFAKERIADLEADGIAYDLVAFTGRDLSPSARIAAQKSIRILENQGLVALVGAHARFVKLTLAGWERLKKPAPSEPANA